MLGNEMTDLNFILESVNASTMMLSFFLLTDLILYIATHIRQHSLSWRMFLTNMPIELTLAFGLVIDKLGIFLMRCAVWSWRRFGAGEASGPMSLAEHHALLIGTVLSGLGTLWLIRILTRPVYGNWPWLAAAAITGGYLTITIAIHFLW